MKRRDLFLGAISLGLAVNATTVSATETHNKLIECSYTIPCIDIEAKIKEIIVDKLGVQENQITPDASFTNDLGADSLDIVELVMSFEEEFDIEIPDEVLEEMITVGDAYKIIIKVVNN